MKKNSAVAKTPDGDVAYVVDVDASGIASGYLVTRDGSRKPVSNLRAIIDGPDWIVDPEAAEIMNPQPPKPTKLDNPSFDRPLAQAKYRNRRRPASS